MGNMVKIQKQKKGNKIIALPQKYIEHMGWSEDTLLDWCPCPDGSGLKLIPLKRGGTT
jgi:hypothetical protein